MPPVVAAQIASDSVAGSLQGRPHGAAAAAAAGSCCCCGYLDPVRPSTGFAHGDREEDLLPPVVAAQIESLAACKAGRTALLLPPPPLLLWLPPPPPLLLGSSSPRRALRYCCSIRDSGLRLDLFTHRTPRPHRQGMRARRHTGHNDTNTQPASFAVEAQWRLPIGCWTLNRCRRRRLNVR